MRKIELRRDKPTIWLPLLLIVTGIFSLAVLIVQVLANPGDTPLWAWLLIIVLLAVVLGGLSWMMLRAPSRLLYLAQGRNLVIQTLASQRTIRRTQVKSIERVNYNLGAYGYRLEPLRSTLPGYYVGPFWPKGLGRVTAFVGMRRGEGLLISLTGNKQLLLNPQDPGEILALFGRETGSGM